MKEAAKRGLPNLRRTPEALAQLVTKQSRDAAHVARHPQRRRSSSRATTCVSSATSRTCSSRCTRCARWSTRIVLPAAFEYSGTSRRVARRRRRAPGIKIDSAGRRGERDRRADRRAAEASRRRSSKVIDKAEGMHDDLREAGGAAHVGRRGRDGGRARSAATRSS